MTTTREKPLTAAALLSPQNIAQMLGLPPSTDEQDNDNE